MHPLIIIGIVLAVLLLILLLPVSLRFRAGDSTSTELKIAFIPLGNKKKKQARAKPLSGKEFSREMSRLEEQEKKKADGTTRKKKKKKDAPLTFENVREILSALRDILARLLPLLLSHLYIRIDRLRVVYGADEAAKTSLATGTMIQTVSWLLEILSRYARFEKKSAENVEILPNFLEEGFRCDVDLFFRIRFFGVFHLLLCAAVLAIRYRDLISKFI
ncbi:MAG: hypothetical protein II797_03330 [Clostridia bacterium]|nr:hypothetical protein [Clostridia bacterium]